MNPPTETKAKRRPRSHYAPLSYERIAILTVAAAGPFEASAIVDEIVGDTVGGIYLSKSTAYFRIKELTNREYLHEQNGSYELTDKGWRTLQIELRRIETQRNILKQRLHV